MEFNFDEIYNQILTEKEACKDPCGVCYMNLNHKKVQLKCSHEFHYECLNKKKYNKFECPYCRQTQSLASLKKLCKALNTNGKICGKACFYSSGLCSKHYDYQEKKCCAIYKSGKNKGNQCEKSVLNQESDYCKRHQNFKTATKLKEIKKLCKYILTRGTNKGNDCCKNVLEKTDYCKKHQDSDIRCIHILTRGKNKGLTCGKKTKNKLNLCTKHDIKKEVSIVV